MEDLKRLVAQTQWLSLDIFDTAVIRAVARPIDLFVLVELRLAAIRGEGWSGFAQARQRAESQAKSISRRMNGREEIRLGEIYAQLAAAGFPSQGLKQALREELRLELHVCAANPEIKEIYHYALSLGKKVVFTSDMYLPQATVRKILTRQGYDVFEDIFLSSTHYQTKHRGGLYRLVLDHAGCRPRELLHIGDNWHSDIRMARKKGITAYHYLKPEQRAGKPVRTRPGRKLPREASGRAVWSLWQGLAAAKSLERVVGERGPDYWYGLGYDRVGILFLGFGAWLIHTARRLGLEALYFMARDGLAPKKVVHLLQKAWNIPLETHYLLGSRRALAVPSITEVDPHALVFLMPDASLPVETYLYRAGLSVPEVQGAIAKFFPSSRYVVKTHQDRKRLAALMIHLEEEIVAAAREEREHLLTYLRKFNLFDRPVGIVDVGWSCNSQADLKRLARLAGEELKATGLYCATLRYARERRLPSGEVRSYLCNLGHPVGIERMAISAIEILELFFTAHHGMVVRFGHRDGEVRPQLEPLDATEQTRVKMARKVQQGALDFVKDFLAAWPGGGPFHIDPQTAWSGVARLVSRPIPEDLEHVGRIPHARWYGVPHKPLVISPPPPGEILRHPYRLLERYGDSFWKFGYLRRLGWPLRMLLAPMHWGLYWSPGLLGRWLTFLRRHVENLWPRTRRAEAKED